MRREEPVVENKRESRSRSRRAKQEENKENAPINPLPVPISQGKKSNTRIYVNNFIYTQLRNTRVLYL